MDGCMRRKRPDRTIDDGREEKIVRDHVTLVKPGGLAMFYQKQILP